MTLEFGFPDRAVGRPRSRGSIRRHADCTAARPNSIEVEGI